MQVSHGRHIKYLFICNIFCLCTLFFCLGLGVFISISISLEGNKTDHPWSGPTQRDHFHLPLLFWAVSEGCVCVCLYVYVHCPLCPALSIPVETMFLSSRVLSLFWCWSDRPHSWGPPAQPAWWDWLAVSLCSATESSQGTSWWEALPKATWLYWYPFIL